MHWHSVSKGVGAAVEGLSVMAAVERLHVMLPKTILWDFWVRWEHNLSMGRNLQIK
jgi:hypothetical protein